MITPVREHSKYDSSEKPAGRDSGRQDMNSVASNVGTDHGYLISSQILAAVVYKLILIKLAIPW